MSTIISQNPYFIDIQVIYKNNSDAKTKMNDYFY
mgnify:CR=1 FL=1